MYVFFRLLKVIVLGFLKPKLEPLAKCKTTLRAWPNDIDYNLHINNGRYLTLMDIGRTDLTVRTGLYKVMLKNKWVPVVGSAQIRFLREIRTLQKFSIESQLFSWDEKWFYMRQEFILGNKVCATAIIKAVFKKRGKTITPDMILDAMGIAQKTPPERGTLIDLFNQADSKIIDP